MSESSQRRIVGNYQLGHTLGSGSFGKVKLASHVITGEKVALKVIRRSSLSKKPQRTAYERELQLFQRLRHPNIIKLFEVLHTPRHICLVLEYAEGGELFDYIIARKRLDEPTARKFFRQISSALHYCHSQEVCHRDLKPENLLLDQNHNIKLIDFGLGNLYKPNELLSTYCGSPAYAAPEMLRGKPYFGPAPDCWSLGVLLYTLLVGRLPYRGGHDVRKVRQSILANEWSRPTDVSKTAVDVMEALLVSEISDRASVYDVCRMQWVNENCDSSPLTAQLLAGGTHTPASTREKAMTLLIPYGTTREAILGAVTAGLNPLSATYHLMVERLRKEERGEKVTTLPPPPASAKVPTPKAAPAPVAAPKINKGPPAPIVVPTPKPSPVQVSSASVSTRGTRTEPSTPTREPTMSHQKVPPPPIVTSVDDSGVPSTPTSNVVGPDPGSASRPMSLMERRRRRGAPGLSIATSGGGAAPNAPMTAPAHKPGGAPGFGNPSSLAPPSAINPRMNLTADPTISSQALPISPGPARLGPAGMAGSTMLMDSWAVFENGTRPMSQVNLPLPPTPSGLPGASLKKPGQPQHFIYPPVGDEAVAAGAAAGAAMAAAASPGGSPATGRTRPRRSTVSGGTAPMAGSEPFLPNIDDAKDSQMGSPQSNRGSAHPSVSPSPLSRVSGLGNHRPMSPLGNHGRAGRGGLPSAYRHSPGGGLSGNPPGTPTYRRSPVPGTPGASAPGIDGVVTGMGGLSVNTGSPTVPHQPRTPTSARMTLGTGRVTSSGSGSSTTSYHHGQAPAHREREAPAASFGADSSSVTSVTSKLPAIEVLNRVEAALGESSSLEFRTSNSDFAVRVQFTHSTEHLPIQLLIQVLRMADDGTGAPITHIVTFKRVRGDSWRFQDCVSEIMSRLNLA